VLRQTVIAIIEDAALTGHANPDEANVFAAGGEGELLIVPNAPHSLLGLQDSSALLTVARRT
jgi:hypothetical protein